MRIKDDSEETREGKAIGDKMTAAAFMGREPTILELRVDSDLRRKKKSRLPKKEQEETDKELELSVNSS